MEKFERLVLCLPWESTPPDQVKPQADFAVCPGILPSFHGDKLVRQTAFGSFGSHLHLGIAATSSGSKLQTPAVDSELIFEIEVDWRSCAPILQV
jgi:hypothetical protein